MSRTKANAPMFERRTAIVLASLVISMTGAAGLLMLLEPTPLAPIGGPVLTVLDPNPRGIDTIFHTHPAPDPHRWRAIVIHHSGQAHGNARTLGDAHQRMGHGGLAHHFVIGNGDGAEDGDIHVGYRWVRQEDGRAFHGDPPADWYNRHAVSICLIGDGDRQRPTRAQMDQLVRLVRALQTRLDIPADHVVLHANIAETSSPGLLFATGAFRQQLIDLDVR